MLSGWWGRPSPNPEKCSFLLPESGEWTRCVISGFLQTILRSTESWTLFPAKLWWEVYGGVSVHHLLQGEGVGSERKLICHYYDDRFPLPGSRVSSVRTGLLYLSYHNIKCIWWKKYSFLSLLGWLKEITCSVSNLHRNSKKAFFKSVYLCALTYNLISPGKVIQQTQKSHYLVLILPPAHTNEQLSHPSDKSRN